MDSEQFISIIKTAVRECAIEDTISNLESPPGRKVSKAELRRSEWFNNLTEEDQNNVESIITDAVDEAIFGLLSIIDGTRAIDNNEVKGKLVLLYKNETEALLNDFTKISLHDLYNRQN